MGQLVLNFHINRPLLEKCNEFTAWERHLMCFDQVTDSDISADIKIVQYFVYKSFSLSVWKDTIRSLKITFIRNFVFSSLEIHCLF